MGWIFLSNYYTHHQKSLCEELNSKIKDGFTFISTAEFEKSRKDLGWSEQENVPFVKKKEDFTPDALERFINEAEVVILGDAPLSLVRTRLIQNKLVFKYSERVFKHGYQVTKWLPRIFTYYKNYSRYKSFYLLSASAYTTVDFAMHFSFFNKSYKWGYFPETKLYDLNELMLHKDSAGILWCGRFLDWKHPEAAVSVAKRLKDEGFSFTLDFVGVGETEPMLRNAVEENDLSDCVNFLGSATPDEVRNYMEKAGVFLFTSDFNEGWGAVLNESMNSGCAVVASCAAGSVPYLIKNNENGFIYKNGDIDDLYNKVKLLLTNTEMQKSFGKKAYHTIVDLWNAEDSVKRLIKFTEEIKDHGYCDLYKDGPCSKAPIISNNWFRG